MNKDSKIIIIGAGISGISSALALKTKGYTNITILEKNDYIGGKLKSIEVEGKEYSVGALQITPGSKNLINYFNSIGITLHPENNIQFFDPKELTSEQVNNISQGYNTLYTYLNSIQDSYKSINIKDFCVENNLSFFFYIFQKSLRPYGYDVSNISLYTFLYILKYMGEESLQYKFSFKEMSAKLIENENLNIKLNTLITSINVEDKIIETKEDTYNYDILINASGISNINNNFTLYDNIKSTKQVTIIVKTEKELNIENIDMNSYLWLRGFISIDKNLLYVYIDYIKNYTNMLYNILFPIVGKTSIVYTEEWDHDIHFDTSIDENLYQGIDDIYYCNSVFTADLLGACFDYAKETINKYF